MIFEYVLTSQRAQFKPNSISKMVGPNPTDFDRWIQHRFSYLRSTFALNPPTFFGGSTVGKNIIDIEIMNWEKHNPKRDQKTYTWLRLNNDIATDPELFGLDAEQKFVWIEILCQASKKNSPSLSVNIPHISHITGVKQQKIFQTLEFLTLKPIISMHDRARSQTSASTTPTDVRTNERDVRTDETYGAALGLATEREPTADIPHADCFSMVFEVFKTRNIKPKLSMSWLHTFPEPDWIIHEISKAITWENANPRKKKKDFGKFMTNWLNRGWDSRRLSSTTNRAEQRTQNNRAAGEAYLKKLEGEK